MSFFFFNYPEDSIEYYYEHQFSKDVASLEVFPIDNEFFLKEFPELKGLSYFGRPEWFNYANDISGVNKKTDKRISKEEFNVHFFTACLFVQILINRVLETYYPDQFKKYEFKKFPRFGWFNFGYSDERLPYLLDVPAKQGIPFAELKYARELLRLLYHIVGLYVIKVEIDRDEFILKICEDFEVKKDKFLKYKSYKLEKDSAFVKFANCLKHKIQRDQKLKEK